MKKSFKLFMFIAILAMYGCQSEEEKIAEQEQLQKQEQELQEQQLNEKITNLTKTAVDYYNEGKILKSLQVYGEIYSLQSSDEAKKNVDALEKEIYNAKQAKKFIDGLYDIQKNQLRSGISVSASDFEYIMKDLKRLIDGFEILDTSKDNSINQFILQLRGDDSLKGYSFLREQANNTVYQDGGTTDAVSALDTSFDVFATGFIALNRDWVLESIDNVLKKKIPNKYDEVINE